jgi:hypothetical protein
MPMILPIDGRCRCAQELMAEIEHVVRRQRFIDLRLGSRQLHPTVAEVDRRIDDDVLAPKEHRVAGLDQDVVADQQDVDAGPAGADVREVEVVAVGGRQQGQRQAQRERRQLHATAIRQAAGQRRVHRAAGSSTRGVVWRLSSPRHRCRDLRAGVRPRGPPWRHGGTATSTDSSKPCDMRDVERPQAFACSSSAVGPPRQAARHRRALMPAMPSTLVASLASLTALVVACGGSTQPARPRTIHTWGAPSPSSPPPAERPPLPATLATPAAAPVDAVDGAAPVAGRPRLHPDQCRLLAELIRQTPSTDPEYDELRARHAASCPAPSDAAANGHAAE